MVGAAAAACLGGVVVAGVTSAAVAAGATVKSTAVFCVLDSPAAAARGGEAETRASRFGGLAGTAAAASIPDIVRVCVCVGGGGGTLAACSQ